MTPKLDGSDAALCAAGTPTGDFLRRMALKGGRLRTAARLVDGRSRGVGWWKSTDTPCSVPHQPLGALDHAAFHRLSKAGLVVGAGDDCLWGPATRDVVYACATGRVLPHLAPAAVRPPGVDLPPRTVVAVDERPRSDPPDGSAVHVVASPGAYPVLAGWLAAWWRAGGTNFSWAAVAAFGYRTAHDTTGMTGHGWVTVDTQVGPVNEPYWLLGVNDGVVAVGPGGSHVATCTYPADLFADDPWALWVAAAVAGV